MHHVIKQYAGLMMLQHGPEPRVRSDAAVPYWRLWSATFLGFCAIGMTIQVMPAYAHDRLGANAITAGLAACVLNFTELKQRITNLQFALATQTAARQKAEATRPGCECHKRRHYISVHLGQALRP